MICLRSNISMVSHRHKRITIRVCNLFKPYYMTPRIIDFNEPIPYRLYNHPVMVGMHPKCLPRVSTKVQRNTPCPCGCGKKTKNCINNLTR